VLPSRQKTCWHVFNSLCAIPATTLASYGVARAPTVRHTTCLPFSQHHFLTLVWRILRPFTPPAKPRLVVERCLFGVKRQTVQPRLYSLPICSPTAIPVFFTCSPGATPAPLSPPAHLPHRAPASLSSAAGGAWYLRGVATACSNNAHNDCLARAARAPSAPSGCSVEQRARAGVRGTYYRDAQN